MVTSSGMSVFFLRQLWFFNPAIHNPRVVLIGAGGIGSPTALLLAKLGIRHLTVYDHDLLAPHNLSTTLYPASMIGRPKVRVLKDVLASFGFPIKVRAIARRFEGQSLRGVDIVISAVDSVKVRKAILRAVRRDRVPLFIDGRIGGENLRVYTVNLRRPEEIRAYLRTLPKPGQETPLPCVAEQVIDIGAETAALIVRAVRNWVKGGGYRNEIIVSAQDYIYLTGAPRQREPHRESSGEVLRREGLAGR